MSHPVIEPGCSDYSLTNSWTGIPVALEMFAIAVSVDMSTLHRVKDTNDVFLLSITLEGSPRSNRKVPGSIPTQVLTFMVNSLQSRLLPPTHRHDLPHTRGYGPSIPLGIDLLDGVIEGAIGEQLKRDRSPVRFQDRAFSIP